MLTIRNIVKFVQISKMLKKMYQNIVKFVFRQEYSKSYVEYRQNDLKVS